MPHAQPLMPACTALQDTLRETETVWEAAYMALHTCCVLKQKGISKTSNPHVHPCMAAWVYHVSHSRVPP